MVENLSIKSKILDKKEIDRTLNRMVHEVLEKNHNLEDLAVIGIRTRGAVLASRMVQLIKTIEAKEVLLGALDITLYRDDLSEEGHDQPFVRSTEISFDISKKRILLVDDVLFTGRTIRAALDALIDLGRPKSIQLAVLIERGHRQFPIQADFVGKSIPTAKKEVVKVHLEETDQSEEVLILE